MVELRARDWVLILLGDLCRVTESMSVWEDKQEWIDLRTCFLNSSQKRLGGTAYIPTVAVEEKLIIHVAFL